jgi:hypothetical protein
MTMDSVAVKREARHNGGVTMFANVPVLSLVFLWSYIQAAKWFDRTLRLSDYRRPVYFKGVFLIVVGIVFSSVHIAVLPFAVDRTALLGSVFGWFCMRGIFVLCVLGIAWGIFRCTQVARQTQVREKRRSQIFRLLNARSDLRSLCSEPIVPYELDIPESPGEKFLIIWVYLQPESVSRRSLLTVVRESVSLVKKSGLISGFKWVELVASVRRANDIPEKIFSMKIEAEEYGKVASLDDKSLEPKDSRTGILGTWYVDPGIVGQ